MSKNGTQALLQRVSTGALGVAGLAGAAVVLGAFLRPEAFLPAWLHAFLFLLALPLGSLALLCLHQLTGGAWGEATQPIFRAAARTLPLLAIAFVPLALGAGSLFPAGTPYLSPPFFIARAILYFAIWIVIARSLDRSLVQGRSFAAAGGALLLYALTMTFAAIDWGMSLEYPWYSTVYGFIFIAGQGLSALALALVAGGLLFDRAPFSERWSVDRLHDVAKLAFAFLLLWAYACFAQLLIVWSGNLAEEVPWYLRRSTHGYESVATLLVLFELVVPFFVLLGAAAKRSVKVAAGVAGWLLLMRAVEIFWLIKPAFAPVGLDLSLLDLATPLLLGGAWLFFFARALARFVPPLELVEGGP